LCDSWLGNTPPQYKKVT